MSFYQYHPLDLATDAIRLVRLHKGYSAEEIRCEVFDTFLHQCDGVPYEALSYTWGDASNPVDINVGGNTALSVTGNLYMALHCLRRSDLDRILWIDAICIDQHNDEEKGHQVRHMRQIYANAERVLIWLGRSTDETDLLMDMMEKLDKRVGKNVSASSKSSDGWKAPWLAMLEEYGGTGTDFHQRRCGALADLLRRAWFKRVWVLQEAANAKRADVVVGWRSIPSRTFVMMPSLMEVPCEKHAQAVLDIMPGPLRQRSWWNSDRSLYKLIGVFSDSEATDPRDKIYALLGLSSDAYDGEVLRPDYGLALKDAIRNAISFVIFGKILDPSVYKFPHWTLSVLVQHHKYFPRLHYETSLQISSYPVVLEMINGGAMKVDETTVQNIKKQTLLDLAKSGLHPNIMQAVLDSDVDPNSKQEGETALSIATRHSKNEMVQLLLRHKDIDLNCRDSECRTPLCAAAELGHYEVAKSILSHKDAGVNVPSGRIISTPLWRAAEKRNETMIKLLLDHGADTDTWSGSESRSALSMAIEDGNLTMVKLLLDYQAKAKMRESCSDETSTPDGNPAAETLLKRSGVLELKNPYGGQTPLVMASEHGNIAMLQYLIDQGANIESMDSAGRTALSTAAAAGKIDVVRFLVNYSADINQRDGIGRTHLALAAEKGHAEVVRFLADSGAEVNTQDKYGRTPLLQAARLWCTPVVKVLLEKDCDVNTPDFSGNTALSVAKSRFHKPGKTETDLIRLMKDKEFEDYLAKMKKNRIQQKELGNTE